MNFKSKNLEEYNRPFSLDELRKSLDKAHDTACGPDDIHYQLLKHIPESTLQTLLDLMNDIWETYALIVNGTVSISPFADGQSGVILLCAIPFSSIFCLNVALTNGGPLSVVIEAGNPSIVNNLSNSLTTFSVFVVLVLITTSNHLE